MLACMAPVSQTKPGDVTERLARLEEQMRAMQHDLDARLDALAESFHASRADEEAETLAAERIRSSAAERTRDGADVLAELGIHTG
jgi:ATP/maltotriose-dependent transcriptional regulator MalT